MKIQRMTSMEEVFAIMPWEFEIQKKGRISYPVQKLLLIIRERIDDPMFNVLFAYDDKKPLGFCIAFMTNVPGDKAIHILRMFAPGIVEKFLWELEQWGKQFGRRTIDLSIDKDVNAVEKRYGFKRKSTIMERGIE